MGRWVLLFKSEKERRGAPDPYRAALEADGWAVAFCDLLSFSFRNLPQCKEELRDPGLAAIALTSPRAACALRDALAGDALSESIRVYCVGECVQRCNGQRIRRPGGSKEDAAALAAQITADWDGEGHVLFFHGEPSLPTLPDRLREAGVPFRPLPVYCSTLCSCIRPPPPHEAGTAAAPAWLVFFSPRGAEAVIRACHHACAQLQPAAAASAGEGGDGQGEEPPRWEAPWVPGPDSCRVASIGATTSDAVRRLGWSVHAQSARPAAEELAAALREAPPP